MEEDKNVGLDLELAKATLRYTPQMSANLWITLEGFQHEATRGRQYLKLTGVEMPPDRVKEILHLKTSAATLGRKFRAASVGDNPQLKRTLRPTEEGRMVVHYRWNPEYKESI